MNRLFIPLLIALFLLIRCELILEDDISGGQLTVLAPNDQDTLNAGAIVFWWEELNGASNYEFQLVDPSFEEIEAVLVDTLLVKNRIVFELDSGSYQWRLRALNGSYKTSFEMRSLYILPKNTN
jgi:hypothetical protein